MEVVKAEFEVDHVPEAIGLSLESLDFVVGTLHYGTGDRMFEEVEKPSFIGSEGFGHSGELSDSGLHGVFEPDIEELLCLRRVLFLPKEPQLLFHGMSNEERLVGLKQSVEPSLAVGLKGIVVSQEKKTITFERLLSQFIELSLLTPSDLIEGVVHESRDVVVIKDDIDTGQPLADRKTVTAAHIHGDSLQPLRFLGKLFKEGADLLFPFALHSMEDSPGLQIGEDGHVFMAFPQAELIDSYVFNLSKRDGSVEQGESLFVNLFHQIPSHSKELGDRADGTKLQQIQNSQCKGSDIAVFAGHERQSGPPEMTTALTLESVDQKIQEASLSPHGAHLEKSSFLPLECSLSATAVRAFHVLVGHSDTDQDAVPKVVSRFIVNTPHPKSMVEYGCGHGLLSPPVRLASNKWGSCHVHPLFSTLGYALSG